MPDRMTSLPQPFQGEDSYPSPERSAIPGAGEDFNAAAASLRAKVHRAVARKTGCRLTAAEAFALDFMEGDGDWWNATRGTQP